MMNWHRFRLRSFATVTSIYTSNKIKSRSGGFPKRVVNCSTFLRELNGGIQSMIKICRNARCSFLIHCRKSEQFCSSLLCITNLSCISITVLPNNTALLLVLFCFIIVYRFFLILYYNVTLGKVNAVITKGKFPK